MRKISIFILIVTVLILSSCGNNSTVATSKALTSTLAKELAIKDDYMQLIYCGRLYNCNNAEITIIENNIEYSEYLINYSEIPSLYLETGLINFDNLIPDKYDKNYYFAEQPFKQLSDLKGIAETIYTKNHSQKSLYDVYDSDYFEYNGQLLWAFGKDTIFALDTDYDTAQIEQITDSEATVYFDCIHTATNENGVIKYTLIWDSGLWKIDGKIIS